MLDAGMCVRRRLGQGDVWCWKRKRRKMRDTHDLNEILLNESH